MGTSFSKVYNLFLNKITEDLYLELTREETIADMQNILISALSSFEFPRFPLFDYDLSFQESNEIDGTLETVGTFNHELTLEELDILSDLMMINWMSRQIISIDNIRMKYSGSDFKFTSQANHLDKLVKARAYYESYNKKKQRMYKRRMVKTDGYIATNYSGLAGGVLK